MRQLSTSLSRRRGRQAAKAERTIAERVLADDETTLLDLVDNVLTRGVVLTGDLTIGLAHVDLVYARLSLLLCAADRIMPGEHPDPVLRLQDRVAARKKQRREADVSRGSPKGDVNVSRRSAKDEEDGSRRGPKGEGGSS